MLMIVKIPQSVGIIRFMSRINVVLSCVEYERLFITSGPGFLLRNTLKFPNFHSMAILFCFECITERPLYKLNPMCNRSVFLFLNRLTIVFVVVFLFKKVGSI